MGESIDTAYAAAYRYLQELMEAAHKAAAEHAFQLDALREENGQLRKENLELHKENRNLKTEERRKR